MSDKKLRLTLLDGTLPLPKLGKRILELGGKPEKRGEKPKKRRKNKGNYKQMMNQIRRGMR